MDRLLSVYQPMIRGIKYWWPLFLNALNVAAWRIHLAVNGPRPWIICRYAAELQSASSNPDLTMIGVKLAADIALISPSLFATTELAMTGFLAGKMPHLLKNTTG